MRYLLILAVALALTIAWQTSVVADIPRQPEVSCMSIETADGLRPQSDQEGADCR
jgi:hypothetical protein